MVSRGVAWLFSLFFCFFTWGWTRVRSSGLNDLRGYRHDTTCYLFHKVRVWYTGSYYMAFRSICRLSVCFLIFTESSPLFNNNLLYFAVFYWNSLQTCITDIPITGITVPYIFTVACVTVDLFLKLIDLIIENTI